MAKKAEKYLVIVESPAKAKTIGKYLGPAYQVKACMGHLRDLPKSKLGVDVENDFEPNYRPIKGKEDIIRDLKQAAKESDAVYLATDPDREGEAISWHLKQLLDLPEDKTFRVTFNEITRKVVTESIRQPRDIDQDLVDAQQARRILDRIVGYELSPLLWKKIRRGLSAGRVQSVAMRLVADREKEIADFVPQEYWTLDALLKNDQGARFKAHYYGRGGKKYEPSSQQEVDGIRAQLQDTPFAVSNVKRTDKRRFVTTKKLDVIVEKAGKADAVVLGKYGMVVRRHIQALPKIWMRNISNLIIGMSLQLVILMMRFGKLMKSF